MATTQQDFGFVGAAYTAANPRQDNQICVNYYVEIDKAAGAKTPTGLLGCPGLVQVTSAVGL
jgi:hypothetical protein